MIAQEFLKFSIVGILATTVHALTALFSVYFLNYGSLQANSIGFISALSISFFMNAQWTFKKKFQWIQLFRFCIIALITYFIIYLISSFSEEANLDPFYSIFLIALVIPFINFLMHKFWTFIQ